MPEIEFEEGPKRQQVISKPLSRQTRTITERKNLGPLGGTTKTVTEIFSDPNAVNSLTARQAEVVSKLNYLETGVKRLKELRKKLSIGNTGAISGPYSLMRGAGNITKGALRIRKEPDLYGRIAESLVTPIVKTVLGDSGQITEADKAPARLQIPNNLTPDDTAEEMFKYIDQIIKERKIALRQGNFGPIKGAEKIRQTTIPPTRVPSGGETPVIQELIDYGIDEDVIKMIKDLGVE